MFNNDVFLPHLFTCMGTMMELSTCFFSFPGYRSKGALPSYWLMPFAWALQTQETLHTWYRHYIISHCSIYLSFKRIMNKIRLVQGSFSCQNVYCQHRSVNTTPCPEPAAWKFSDSECLFSKVCRQSFFCKVFLPHRLHRTKSHLQKKANNWNQ